MNPLVFLSGSPRPDASGTWHDTIASGATNANHNGNPNRIWAQAVTVGEAGSATKLRIYIRNFSGSPEVIKMSLHDPDGFDMLGSGTVEVSGTGYYEVTLGSPVSVTAQTYGVAFAYVGGAADVGYDDSTGTYLENTDDVTYSAFPYNPYPMPPQATPTGTFAVGIFIT